MFDVDFSELAVVGIVALLVVGPKDLPRLLRTVGQWMGRARGMARHVRSGFDTMVREAEIEEMNKRWEQQNAEIMAATRVDSWMDATDEPAPDRRPDPQDRPLMLPDDAVRNTAAASGALPPGAQPAPAPSGPAPSAPASPPADPPPYRAPVTADPGKPPAGQLA